jgi:hypothetical protein
MKLIERYAAKRHELFLVFEVHKIEEECYKWKLYLFICLFVCLTRSSVQLPHVVSNEEINNELERTQKEALVA